MLQGRVSGVQVTSDGQPGAFPSVRIRGISTFGNGQPLYVIDGVPVGTTPRDFNPNDVESMQVLKDASAGAIYGSRAANGVVIITTKQGKKNSPLKVEYNTYVGVDQVWQRIPVLGREDYQMIINEVQRNGNQPLVPANDPNNPRYITDIDTDWQKEGLKNGFRQNHNLNFSGGGEYTQYNASVDYFENRGTLVGNGPNYERYSMRMNTLSEKGRLKVGSSLYYTHSYEDALTFRPDVLAGNRPPLIADLVQGVAHNAVFRDGDQFYIAHQGRPTADRFYMIKHVRKLYWTEDGWPVASPQRYANLPMKDIQRDDLVGTWEQIILGYRVVPGYADEQFLPDLQESADLTLNADGSIGSDAGNVWTYQKPWLTLNYGNGAFIDKVYVDNEYDWEKRKETIIYTGLNNEGTAIWAKKK